MIGLCLGGGQLGLGMAATVLAILTLWALKWLDVRIPREHRATLVISGDTAASATVELTKLIAPAGYRAQLRRQSRSNQAEPAKLWYEISWRQAEILGAPSELVKLLNERYAAMSLELSTEGRH